MGVIHKNMSIEAQALEVDRVKRSEHGIITNPVFLAPDNSIQDALNIMERYRISGVPITVKGKLVGILTNRDLRFETDFSKPISEAMTKENLVTAPEGTTIDEAREILKRYRIEKLPIVDQNFMLKGLVTIKDIQKMVKYPNSCKDENGRLRCAAAISIGADSMDRADALVAQGVDALVLDTAHGHQRNVLKAMRELKKRYPHTDVIGGNIATAEAAEALIEAGADCIKVGVGPGSICTTA